MRQSMKRLLFRVRTALSPNEGLKDKIYCKVGLLQDKVRTALSPNEGLKDRPTGTWLMSNNVRTALSPNEGLKVALLLC